MASKIRYLTKDGRYWYPVLDTAHSLRSQKGGLRAGVAAWLRNNLPDSDVQTLSFPKTDGRKAGRLIAVAHDQLRIVGMYASHIAKGGNFRARWSELPDYPDFDREMKVEAAWRNLYRWSRATHKSRGGIPQHLVSEMRQISQYYYLRHGENPQGSWEETKAEYLSHCLAQQEESDRRFAELLAERDRTDKSITPCIKNCNFP